MKESFGKEKGTGALSEQKGMDTLESGSVYSGCSFMVHSFVKYTQSPYERMSIVQGLGMENVELLTVGNC